MLLRKILPRSLLGRVLVILLAPLIIVQLVMGYIFYEYHIEDRLNYTAKRIASEISYIRTHYEKKHQDFSFLQDFSLSLGRQYRFKPFENKRQKSKSCILNNYIMRKFSLYFQKFEPEAKICLQSDGTYLVENSI